MSEPSRHMIVTFLENCLCPLLASAFSWLALLTYLFHNTISTPTGKWPYFSLAKTTHNAKIVCLLKPNNQLAE
jgi:hypothetical protein